MVTQEPMQSFKIVAFLLLTDSGGFVKFTPKYTIEGGEGGDTRFFFKASNLILLVTEEPMQKKL